VSTAAPACLARIPYLNAVPFYQEWNRVGELSRGLWRTANLPPRQLGQAAERGEVDAGLMAAADLFRLERDFEPVVPPPGAGALGFGVGARTRVDSVLLFARGTRDGAVAGTEAPVLGPADMELCHGGAIGLTGESSTSVRLLRLLLEVRHGLRPASYERLDLERLSANENHAALLVIGDLALRWLLRPPMGYHLAMDLAAEWYAWTGLPFVFAQWSVRRSLPAPVKSWLAEYLAGSLRRTGGDYLPLVQDLPDDMGSREALVTYLSQFAYAFESAEIEGRERYRQLLDEHGLL
jgi:predicted solute-binding protein